MAEKKPEPVSQKVKEVGIEVEGIVREALKGKFRVEITPERADPNATPVYVLGHLSGKLRQNFIKIVPGDKVKIEISPYDITRGRITFRLK
jgi:translation initiation factor IF-1